MSLLSVLDFYVKLLFVAKINLFLYNNRKKALENERYIKKELVKASFFIKIKKGVKWQIEATYNNSFS